MRCSVALICTVVFVVSVSPVAAQSGIEIGVLECRGVATNYVVSSLTNMNCVYRSASGRSEGYTARIQRYGLDIGVNQSTALAWAVFAPTYRLGPGSLSGTYVGGSANVTVGVGLGANALVGGSNNTFALQPVSLQGQTGIGAAAGVSAMELRTHYRRR